jgi:hypothetical protein
MRTLGGRIFQLSWGSRRQRETGYGGRRVEERSHGRRKQIRGTKRRVVDQLGRAVQAIASDSRGAEASVGRGVGESREGSRGWWPVAGRRVLRAR